MKNIITNIFSIIFIGYAEIKKYNPLKLLDLFKNKNKFKLYICYGKNHLKN